MIESKLNNELVLEIQHTLRRLNTERELAHEKSGKLSASKLGAPLLEQVLYVLGVPPKPADDYALGLFRRGISVEESFMELLNPDTTQEVAEYRNTIGYIDAIRNGMVYEIKSVKNSMVKYIDPANTKKRRGVSGLEPEYTGVKYAHALQATFYGMARNDELVTIIYVSADDFRIYPHIIKTNQLSSEVDAIIDDFEATLKSGMLPAWKAREAWQNNQQYSSYPDWMMITPEQAMQKLEQQYPQAYNKLKGIPDATTNNKKGE